MLGLMQLGGALRNWMPAKTQKTARSVRIGQQPAAGGAAGTPGKEDMTLDKSPRASASSSSDSYGSCSAGGIFTLMEYG